MTSFSPEPEFWIEDGPEDGAGDWEDWGEPGAGGGDEGPPGGPSGPVGGGRRRRWLRWAALGTGLVVIAGLIAWQNRSGSNPEASDQTTAQTSPLTTPSTWAPTATGPAAIADHPPLVLTDAATWVDNGVTRTLVPVTPGDSNATIVPGTDCCTDTVLGPGTRTESPPGVAAAITLVDDGLALPGAEGWELQAYRHAHSPGGYLDTGDQAALIRYRPADGRLVGIAIPDLKATGQVSFVARGETVIIRPQDSLPGYVISPQGVVSQAAGEFVADRAISVYPGPRSDQVWVVGLNSFPTTFRLTDSAGRFLGAEFSPPEQSWFGGYGPAADGAGYLTTRAVGGTYLLQPYGDGFRRITTGIVLAAGLPGFLTYDCDETALCGTYYVDRATWTATEVSVDSPPRISMLTGGVISPDGSVAAMIDFGGSGLAVYLLDLTTGKKSYLKVSLPSSFTGDGSQLLAFSPDGRYLMVAGRDGIVPVDVATGTALPMLPTGPVDALAIESIG